MELTKGDWDNLEGKVTVYSKLRYPPEIRKRNKGVIKGAREKGYPLKEGPREELIFAIYITPDSADFIEKTDLPEDVSRELIEKANYDVEFMNKSSQSKGEETIPFYGSSISVESEIELLLSQGDVLFTGEHPLPDMCMQANEEGIMLYSQRLAKQLADEKAHVPKKETEEITYEDIEPSDTRDYFLKNYIFPMLDAAGGRGEKDLRSLQEDFLRFLKFSTDSILRNAAEELCEFIEHSGGNQDTDGLVDAYVNKIIAIREERYEEAAKIRDDIKRLKAE